LTRLANIKGENPKLFGIGWTLLPRIFGSSLKSNKDSSTVQCNDMLISLATAFLYSGTPRALFFITPDAMGKHIYSYSHHLQDRELVKLDATISYKVEINDILEVI
jgi:hypothetical protein